MPRQATRKKLFKINIFLPSNFPQIWGNYPDFRKILNTFDFPPNLGKYPSFEAKSINSDFIEVIDESGTTMQGFLTPSLVLEKRLSENIYTDQSNTPPFKIQTTLILGGGVRIFRFILNSNDSND